MSSLVKALNDIPVESAVNLSTNNDLLHTLFKKKPVDHCTTPNTDITSDILEEAEMDRHQRIFNEHKRNESFEKVSTCEIFRTEYKQSKVGLPRVGQNSTTISKRPFHSPSKQISEECIALKKRAKMFQSSGEFSANHDNVIPGASMFSPAKDEKAETLLRNDLDEPVQTPSRAVFDDDMDGYYDFERELLESTYKAEAEYFEKAKNTQHDIPNKESFHVAELSSNMVVSSFTSTRAEKDVYNDIVARVPKTVKSKT
jgi:hypothetical protein